MNEENRNQLLARVQMECRRRRIPVSELANRIGRTSQSLHQVLARNTPTMKTIERLCEALGMDRQSFLEPITTEEYGEVMFPRNEGPKE